MADDPDALTPRAWQKFGDPIYGTNGSVYYRPWAGPVDEFWNYRGDVALAAGGGFSGKTEALRWYPWQQMAEETQRIRSDEIDESKGLALITRRHIPKLRELISRCALDYPKACPDAKWSSTEKTWTFPSGYKIVFGHMAEEDDWNQYQGWHITCWCPDELSFLTEKQYNMVSGWVRSPAGCLLKPIIRGGSNWIGPGLEWVRRKFYEAATPGKEIVTEVKAEIELEDRTRKTVTVKRSQICILATVRDNKSVDQAAYIASMADKPEPIRRAIIEGDPYVVEEGLIAELWDKQIHVVRPFQIPSGWQKFRSMHYGHLWPNLTSILWWAVDTAGNLTCYRSLSATGRSSAQLSADIKAVETEAGEWNVHYGHSKLSGPLMPQCFGPAAHAGKTIAETMADAGVMWEKADGDVASGVEQLRIRLARRSKHPTKKGVEVPGIRFFDTCWNLVRNPLSGDKVKTGPTITLPILSADKENPDVWDKKSSVSDAFAVSYACVYREIAASKDVADPKADDEDDDMSERRREGNSGWSSGGYWT